MVLVAMRVGSVARVMDLDARAEAFRRLLDADLLRYSADLTVPAIAGRLGIAEGTVKSRLHHALRRMREAMGDPEGMR